MMQELINVKWKVSYFPNMKESNWMNIEHIYDFEYISYKKCMKFNRVG